MDRKNKRLVARALLRAADALDQKAQTKKVSASVDQVKKLISQNHHGEALQMAASMAKVDAKLYKAIKAMNEIQDYFGSLPQGLDYVRSALSKRVKAHLNQKATHLDDEEKAELLRLV